MKPGRAVLLSFVIIAICFAAYEFLDQPAARFFAAADHRIKHVFDLITWLGVSTPYLAATSAGYIYCRFIKKNETLANAAAFLFISLALSGLANDLIKVLVGRSRPCLLLTEGIYGFRPFTHQYYYASFPSGHANTIAALCYGLYAATGRFNDAITTAQKAIELAKSARQPQVLKEIELGAYLGVVVTALIAAGFEKRGRMKRRRFPGPGTGL